MRGAFLGIFIVPLTALTIASLCGCDNDAELARMAETAADRQAEQNKEMVQLNREVAEGTKRLVEAGASSREDFFAIQCELQNERARIGHQRDRLEDERRAIADQRLRESLVAPVLDNLGPLLVVVAVLFFCGLLVSGLSSDNGEGDAVAEILIREMVAERPNILPPQASRHSVDNGTPTPPVITDQSDADAKVVDDE